MNNQIHFRAVARCGQCGSDNLSATGSEPSWTPVICRACGANLGTVANVEAQLHRNLDKEVAKQTEAIGREFHDLFRKALR